MIKLLFCLLLLVSQAAAQAKNGEGSPKSLESNLDNENVPVIKFAPIDREAALREDAERTTPGGLRFGIKHKTEIDVVSKGLWTTSDDGQTMILRLRVRCMEALTTKVVFNKVVLPDDAQLFIYNSGDSVPESHFMLMGPYTNARTFREKFPVQSLYGEELTVELNVPRTSQQKPQLVIRSVTHGYRERYGPVSSSGSCNINVACDVPVCSDCQAFADQVRSVALIESDNDELCSGSLLNNEKEDELQYFLTAGHCDDGFIGDWIFIFNYEGATCTASGGPTTDSVEGGADLVDGTDSDFLLLEIGETIPTSYDVYFNGWSAATSTPTEGTVIHHPSGDIKKISFDYDTLTSDNQSGGPANSRWSAVWDDGTTELISDGGPLYDQNKRVVGQFASGTASCTNTLGYAEFGKFSVSYGTGTPTKPMLEYLDPDDTGITTLDGKTQEQPARK